MAGHLEEGINHTADLSVQSTLNLPGTDKQSKTTEVVEMWNGEKLIVSDNKLTIYLGLVQTKPFTLK
jgi:hypothetical protein